MGFSVQVGYLDLDAKKNLFWNGLVILRLMNPANVPNWFDLEQNLREVENMFIRLECEERQKEDVDKRLCNQPLE